MCCKNYPIVTGKTTVSFNKVAGLQAFHFIEKRLQHRCFLVNIEKFLRTNFLKEHLWTATSEGSFYVKKKKLSFLSYQNSNRVREKTSVSFKSCFPLAEVINNFLVSWNYGLKNFICSSKESIISQGSLPPKFFNDESSRKKN